MRNTLLCAGLAALFVGTAPTAHADSKDPKIPFEKYVLPNGLEIILHQDKSVPLVAVNVWYHVGSGDETPGKTGFAHLFEHMMFQGSKNVGEDKHFSILKNIGASGVNGTTNPDRTNYFEVVPSHQLETALWLESDRMSYMLPLVTEKSFRNQVEVVRNERRQNYDNRPFGRTRFAKAAAMYPAGHPYRYLTIGRHEDLNGATLKDVVGFYKKWYVPANATLVLAGDFEIPAAKALVNKYFGGFPKTKKPARQIVKAPVLRQKKRITVEDPLAKLRRIEYVWASPAFFKAGDAELDLVANALTARGTGRLYKRLVHETQLAQSVSAFQGSRQFSSEFTISVTLRSNANLAQVETIINEELAKVSKSPISQREFNRAVVQMESGFIWGLESLNARAQQLQSYNHYVGTPKFLTQDLDRWRKSSPVRVQQTVARHLKSNNRLEALTVPASKQVRAGKKLGGKVN